MHTLKRVTVASTALVFMGCQTIKNLKDDFLHPPAPVKKPVIERSWAVNTLSKNWELYRRQHRMTPVAFEDLIIAGNSIDGISAYKRTSGRLKWHLKIVGGVEGGAQLYDERLFFGAGDGNFYGVEARTGKVLWTFPIKFEGLAMPVVKNGQVYVLSGANTAYALEAATGKQIWIYTRKENLNLSVRGGSQPVIFNDSVILGFSDGFLVALNATNGTLQWERQLSTSKQFTDIDATPVVDENFIYVSSYDGTLYCLSRKDGQLVWRIDEGGYEPVTVDGERLYFSSVSQKLLAIERKTGAIIWQMDFKKGQGTRPLLYQGMLLTVQNGGPVELRSKENGHVITQFITGRGAVSAPLTLEDSGEIFVLSNEGNLFALKVARKSHHELTWPY